MTTYMQCCHEILPKTWQCTMSVFLCQTLQHTVLFSCNRFSTHGCTVLRRGIRENICRRVKEVTNINHSSQPLILYITPMFEAFDMCFIPVRDIPLRLWDKTTSFVRRLCWIYSENVKATSQNPGFLKAKPQTTLSYILQQHFFLKETDTHCLPTNTCAK